MKEEVKVVIMPVAELTPYEHNPRNNEQAVDAVAASIKEFGFRVPLVIDREGVVITGHTRLKAVQKLGIKEVPCIVADDLTPEQVRAFRLADNKVGELAEWDEEKLAEELQSLVGMFEFDVFGFRPDDFRSDEELEDDFGEGNAPGAKEKKAKMMKCPNCGREFEV